MRNYSTEEQKAAIVLLSSLLISASGSFKLISLSFSTTTAVHINIQFYMSYVIILVGWKAKA